MVLASKLLFFTTSETTLKVTITGTQRYHSLSKSILVRTRRQQLYRNWNAVSEEEELLCRAESKVDHRGMQLKIREASPPRIPLESDLLGPHLRHHANQALGGLAPIWRTADGEIRIRKRRWKQSAFCTKIKNRGRWNTFFSKWKVESRKIFV